MPQGDTRRNFEEAAFKKQGDFRDSSPTISAEGRNPEGHLLASSYECENLYPGIRERDQAVKFFSDRKIKWWRSRLDKGPNRPTRHMASSQVACVNFMLPLASMPDALLAAIRAIDKDVNRIVPIKDEGNSSLVSLVEFEWIGVGKSLEGTTSRGFNSTSIDAYVVAETDSGLRAYLLEWKYVEKYLSSKPDFKGEGNKGETRKGMYCPLYYADDSSFNLEAAPEMDEFLYEPFYQLMRQRLLADSMEQSRKLGVDEANVNEAKVVEAKVVVVVPEENLAYRQVTSDDGKFKTSPPLAERFPGLTVEEVMRAVLKEPDKQFAMVAPRKLLDAAEQAGGSEVRDWANYWRERYGV